MGKTIAQLTPLAATPDDTDNLIIDDGGVTKKITAANFKGDCVRSAKNNALSASTGTQIGTAANQLLGFYGATPVDQPAVTADLLDSLQEIGLIESGAGNTPLNLSAGAVTCGALTAGAASVSSVTSTGAISGTTLTGTGAISGTSISGTGAITTSSSTGGIGYATGAGSTVTQSTSKATGVTLNNVTGRITLHNSQLNANTTTSFALTNSTIAATDLLVLNHVSVGTAGAYSLNAQCAAGSASISVRNITSGNLSEAIVIGFAVIKSVTA